MSGNTLWGLDVGRYRPNSYLIVGRETSCGFGPAESILDSTPTLIQAALDTARREFRSCHYIGFYPMSGYYLGRPAKLEVVCVLYFTHISLLLLSRCCFPYNRLIF